jgi:copper chaperone CopZ
MKSIVSMFFILTAPTFVFAAKDTHPTTAPATKESTAPQTKTFALNVTGMTCGSCAEKVEAALMGLDGVTGVSVNHETGRTVIMLKASAKIGEKEITSAIKDAGYDVKI